nr:MAG TPA: hypothetical protein [Caudoviricetes sp.]
MTIGELEQIANMMVEYESPSDAMGFLLAIV